MAEGPTQASDTCCKCGLGREGPTIRLFYFHRLFHLLAALLPLKHGYSFGFSRGTMVNARASAVEVLGGEISPGFT